MSGMAFLGMSQAQSAETMFVNSELAKDQTKVTQSASVDSAKVAGAQANGKVAKAGADAMNAVI